MIVVSLGAGLGNQMFEFAFYEHLRRRFPKQSVKFDPNYAFPLAHNGIELFDIFGINADIATEDEVLKLTKGVGLRGCNSSNSLIKRIRNKLRLYPDTMRFQKDFSEFYSDFFDIKDESNIYFYGPFANFKYFKEISDDIKKIFQFPCLKDERNIKYYDQIISNNSVSIHVRKGDYVLEGIQLTSLSFYNKAINYIESKIENPVFFVFSDDLEYAHELFGNDRKFVYVQGNKGKQSYIDMQLMSLCKHNITANSTFSFWGAFLNTNISKIVISPNLPFSGTKHPFVCDDWILM